MTTNQDAMEAAVCAVENAAHENFSFAEAVAVAIPAYLAACEAEGFVMVPVEPTMKMREEGLFANEDALLMSADCNDMANAYRAMLAARPTNGDS